MCKTKTLIYTFTNRRALDECLDNISRNYNDKEIVYFGTTFIDDNMVGRNTLPYEELIALASATENMEMAHSVTLKEIRDKVKDSQNIIGEIVVEI